MSNAGIFSSPPTTDFPLPYDIAHLIITQYLHRPDDSFDEYIDFDALSRANRFLRSISLPLLYRRLEFNLQRRRFQGRMIEFIDLLQTNPLLATFVRALVITDNIIQFAHRNEAKYELNMTASWRWLSAWDMKEEERHQVFSDEEGIGTQLAEAVKTMNSLRTLIISFVYRPLQWKTLSTHFRRGFQDAAAQQGLRNLFLQGVSGVPQRVLERFASLKRLDLIDATIEPASYSVDNPDDTQEATYHQNGRAKLSVLALRNVPAEGGLSLLKFWKEDAARTHYGVDMSCPQAIDIFFGNSKDIEVPRQALLLASSNVKTLQLHALALGLDNATIVRAVYTAFPMEHPSESGGYNSFSDWFATMALVRSSDLAGLASLEELSIQISHWPDRVGPNEEIRWALTLLKSVPTQSLVALIVRINIGGYLGSDNAALADFDATLEPLWSLWGEEFRNEKWAGLKSLTLELLGHFDIVAYDFRVVTLRLLKNCQNNFREAFSEEGKHT